jgi:hypothetical protein
LHTEEGEVKSTTGTRLAYLAVLVLSAWMAGCASGDFSTQSPPVTPPPTPAANPNPPSLPSLAAATPVNDYVGTQMPGFSYAPENTVALHLDSTALSYASSTVLTPQVATPSLPDSSGTLITWANYWNLGDNSGANGLPGLQEYGLSIEIPSRLAFFVASAGAQISAEVPRQNTSCITPTSAATYEYITLFGAAFNVATDTAYGTVQISASGNAFAFLHDAQFTQAATAATTGLIPFSAASCIESSDASDLGRFIDIPPAMENGNTEVRAFLGPTGLLAANQQDANGDPLPGLVGMVEPSSPLDVTKLTASGLLYRAIEFEFGGAVTQWGYAAHHSDGTYVQAANPFDVLPGSFLDLLELAASSSPSTISFSAGFPTFSFSFGTQDTNNPGLFPNAQFVYYPGGSDCPTGTQLFSVVQQTTFCSSPAIGMAAQHDGKYVVLITGTNALNGAPTLFVLVQN